MIENSQDYTTMASQVGKLQSMLEAMQEEHLRLLSVITHALGGELRVRETDFLDALGVTLYSQIDPATGDLVYLTRHEGLPNA